ncbi:MAG TPA: hypothetical protein ENG63_07670 [Candidatus Desulfofervidus auxilii]|uniref:Terminase large subunit gp17-like C-terminal domain-containing protein n=1 Tax=Desulfofervidus auxilii TaxID=1621989 RepID=A0A7C0U3A1_DESA2|nr:hypothetical protein [Candidatus Desulfofervidus auxilii]
MKIPKKLSCILNEIDNCSFDPIHFFQYISINHPKVGKIKVELFPKQKYILFNFLEKHHLIILKSRQTGISTLFQLIVLWLINFQGGHEIVILSKGDRESKKHIEKIKQMYETLPGWLKAKVLKSNEHEFALSFSGTKKTISQVTALPVKKEIGRTFSASLLIIDEAAFIPGIEEIWSSISPIIAAGGQIVIISTPKQVNSWFHKQWKEANEGLNEFLPITVSWKELPEEEFKRRGFESGIEWYHSMCKKLRRKKDIASELDMSFIASGDNYIDSAILELIEKNVILNEYHWSKKPIKLEENDKLFIYEMPIPNEKYYLGADVAEGIGKNYSTFYIIRSNEKIVAEYKDNLISPNNFADLIYKYAKIYNDALLNIELNNHGRVVIGVLLEKYKYNKIMSTYDPLTQKWADKPGWEESAKSKQLVLNTFKNKVEENYLNITYRLGNECMTFITDPKTGKPVPMAGCFSDLIIAFGLAHLALKYGDKFLLTCYIPNNESQISEPIIDISGIESLDFEDLNKNHFTVEDIEELITNQSKGKNLDKLINALEDLVIV